MNPDYLRELDLLPIWSLRAVGGAATVTAAPESKSPTKSPPAHDQSERPQTSAAASSSADGGAAVKADYRPPPKSPPAHDQSERPQTSAAASSPPMAADWVGLRRMVMSCRACGLCEGRTQAVFGVGHQGADIFLVGEGPGQEEDRRGEPFVGAAGRLLDDMLYAIGRSRERDVYIANVVKCRPPANRNPEPDEARACLGYLARQIELAQPRLIVALGKVAATYLLETTAPIGALRQKLHDYRSVPVIVTYHPAYLLRSPAEKRKAWDDLKFIQKAAS